MTLVNVEQNGIKNHQLSHISSLNYYNIYESICHLRQSWQSFPLCTDSDIRVGALQGSGGVMRSREALQDGVHLRQAEEP